MQPIVDDQIAFFLKKQTMNNYNNRKCLNDKTCPAAIFEISISIFFFFWSKQ